eukprot:9388263-Pyramimonas_sp.AAC.1
MIHIITIITIAIVSAAPLTRLVAPQGAPPNAKVAVVACVTAAPFCHIPHTVRGPIGSSTEGFSGS